MMQLWNRDTALLLALIMLGASLLVMHLLLSLRAWRTPSLHRALRWLAWLPPLGPVAGFLCGARGLAVLWCVVAGAYLVLRTLV